MSAAVIEREIRDFLLAAFPNDDAELSASTPLLEEWFVDSLGLLDVVLFLEVRFGIEVRRADIDAETFHSITTLTSFVQSRLPAP